MNLISTVKGLLVLSFFLVSVCALPVGAQTTHKLYAFVNDAKGDVEIKKADTQTWAAATTESIISAGDQIRTGPFSNLQLVFADSSFIMVDSFSHLTINKFSVTDNVVGTNLFLSVGSVISTLNDNVSFENKYTIMTPATTISLKGGEIKKVVVGAMYNDTIRTNNKKYTVAVDKETGETAKEKKGQKVSSLPPN
ncbi:LipL45 protein [Candidatus Scalindua japonica]|uniref:LipL45 protein n=1 Tax=Candidatus Scalindua japonica TaxID=1284222 RepID=A0A286U3F5_9BACT|nr:FecR domain-containing protein [Candidatus Scalindua japonica]GAX62659.1 LipL45 protein [Candidatus Scalindua japonica]